MAIVTVGSDLAKNVFAVHGVDTTGKPALICPSVPRSKLLQMIASLPPCLIGMEACSGVHHCAREFEKFVVPYRLSGKGEKNDAAVSAAICEAVTRNSRLWTFTVLGVQSLSWQQCLPWSDDTCQH